MFVISPLAGRGHQAFGALPLPGFISCERVMSRPRENRNDDNHSGQHHSTDDAEFIRAIDSYKTPQQAAVPTVAPSARLSAVVAVISGGPGSSRGRGRHSTTSGPKSDSCSAFDRVHCHSNIEAGALGRGLQGRSLATRK